MLSGDACWSFLGMVCKFVDQLDEVYSIYILLDGKHIYHSEEADEAIDYVHI